LLKINVDSCPKTWAGIHFFVKKAAEIVKYSYVHHMANSAEYS